MCGICGQFNFAGDEPVEPEIVRRMTDSIAHRGPDDEGYFFSGPLGLGFRRLSIIDLAGGHQPMFDAQQTVCIIFNGEIYNYKELRQELKNYGHCFRTNSDTEVIIQGYKEWGIDVLNHLNGMFGIAIWDLQRKRLVVARDAMGIKLVYYRIAGGRFTFGSEIRAVLAGEQSHPEIDPTALNLFLRFRYTPSPLTLFQGIRKLAPGTMLVLEGGKYREERWYDYTPIPFSKPREDEEAAHELLELYRGAVRRHLLSDVPVGILLSGGIDSGLLLALMNEQGGPWPAYTVGYGEVFEDDELADAKETASLFGARYVPVKLDQAEFERLGVRYGNWWRWLPTGLQSVVGFAVNGLSRNETLKRGVSSLGTENRLKRYQDVFSLAPESTIHELFREGLLPEPGSDGLVEYWRALLPQMKYTDELGGFQLLEIRSSLPDELLMYADKLSMAHSLELRVPYLDRTVVEYIQRLGANLKIRRSTRKWLHRQVCQRYLPPRILKRKKRGFAVNVVDAWFRSSVRGQLSELLLDDNSLMYNLLEREPVRKLLSDHRSGRQDHHKLLFSLVMIEQWLRRTASNREQSAQASIEVRHAVAAKSGTHYVRQGSGN